MRYLRNVPRRFKSGFIEGNEWLLLYQILFTSKGMCHVHSSSSLFVKLIYIFGPYKIPHVSKLSLKLFVWISSL